MKIGRALAADAYGSAFSSLEGSSADPYDVGFHLFSRMEPTTFEECLDLLHLLIGGRFQRGSQMARSQAEVFE